MKALLISVALGTALLGTTTRAISAEGIQAGINDSDVGAATRAMLDEQREGINRGPIEPYRAESAGKAYRAYVDSIGQKEDAPDSQLDKVK